MNKLPAGFRYSAMYAGIRKVKKNDLALIVADMPAAAAAVFTTNVVAAAPVVLGRAHLQASGGRVRAVLINAGNANCATRTGERVALATAKAAAKVLKCAVEEVVPSSTGVIGVELDAKPITGALPELVAGLSAEKFDETAEAIMTTDLVKKTAFAEGAGFRVAGMTKGSGMIHPNMATTLGFVMTDAVVEPKVLQAALRRVVGTSYNRLSVDGDMSTNDTLLVLASGASGVAPKRAALEGALEAVCQSLAKQIARDGEGARKLVEIVVSGARTNAEAARVGRAIANSPLVKTAIAGADANWGRILCAAGYSGVVFDPRTVDIRLQGVRVCRQGLAAAFDEGAMKKKLAGADVRIELSLGGAGEGGATFWTCDLTEGYIEINGSYRT
ncbi:MAG: bifunctional glutamate N-acetyltransferase/amino-acid acetyltransferase ArgJ [Bryobacteraceae bacterium]|nr:bifunctional glutamate N-acetyltransferase/amino-acid acetyltransferase ArgJ [Bryobacteraceae bacterium]